MNWRDRSRAILRAGPLWPLAVIVGVALVLAAPVTLAPSGVPFPPRSAFSDIALSHWPSAEFIRRSLAEHGQWPLWNPTLLGGQPLAADPLAGMWYPPNLLLLMLPLPLGFNLLFLFHLMWGGWGAFRWLQVEGYDAGPALLGGLIVAGSSKLAAHYGAGHMGLVMAVVWMPWLLQGVALAGTWRAATRPGVALALLFLADVRWAAYAGVLAGAYWLWGAPLRVRAARRLPPAGFALVVSVLLAAVLWVPLAEFVQLSGRAGLSLEEANAFALPAGYLVGTVAPNFGGLHEWMVYLGWAPMLLAVVGATIGRPGGPSGQINRRVFWIGVALLAGLWSLGASGGLFALAFRWLPGTTLLRVPPRAWFLVVIAVAWLAANGMDTLVAARSPAALSGMRLASTGCALLAAMLAVGVVGLGGAWPTPFLWLAVVAVVTALVLMTAGRRLVWLLAGVVVVDLAVVNASLIDMRPNETLLAEGSALAEYIAAEARAAGEVAPPRVYSPSFSLPPLTAVRAGLLQLEGVSPLYLATTAEYLPGATGVPHTGYSVVLPPVVGDPHASNAGATPSAGQLGRLNVRWVASAFPVEADGLTEVGSVDETVLYENEAAHGWAWLNGAGSATVASWTPNHIALRVTVDGEAQILWLAQPKYPGWQAAVDGRPTAPLPETWLAVPVSPGTHDVVLAFQPVAVQVGVGLSVVGLALVAVLEIGLLRRRANRH